MSAFTEDVAENGRQQGTKKEAEMSENDTWPEFGFRCGGGVNCVVVEKVAGCVVIRDSKNPAQPGLVFSRKEYADFRRRVRDRAGSRAVLRLMTAVVRIVMAGLRQIVR
jgi:hypothetical protein